MSDNSRIYEKNFVDLIHLVESMAIAHAPGKLLYSSQSTLIGGDYYVIGYNPGGNSDIEPITVLEHLRQTPTKSWTEFTHAEWFYANKLHKKGMARQQKRVVSLFAALNIDIKKTFLTNAIFPRGNNIDTTRAHSLYKEYLDECAAVHGFLINIIKPRIIISFGPDARKTFLNHEKSNLFKNNTDFSSAKGSYQIVELPHFSARWDDTKFLSRATSAMSSHLGSKRMPVERVAILDDFPIVIVQDRYGGTYSGGKWLAIAEATRLENGAYRIVRSLEDGPHGDDTDASLFWLEPPDWISAGATPDEALHSLKAQLAARRSPISSQ